MALTPGTRLGIYEVTAQIGAGGMGEVYRATDTKLKRKVAIKILPPSLAANPDRLARFQREAEVLASLNHPHIAGIYGLEESDGISALAMELVEGEDLSQRIGRGAIPLDEALPIAKQIADALECAHEQGIIHRDLKPANIKVRADGTVKVLDFGLAKAMDPSGQPSANAMNSPTVTTPAMTLNGVILGTAAYMAPEQAKGRAVDKRADIWAFGVVLFEMLTGRRLFDAEDVSETLAAVLTRDVSLTMLPSAIPSRLRALLRDCLIRDPRQRLRDIGAARIVLDQVIAGAHDDAPVTAAVVPPLRRAVGWAVVVALAAGLSLGTWALWRADTVVDRPLARLDVDLGAKVSLPLPTASGSSVTISPDGTRLVYGSGTPVKLFTRRLDQSNATELPGTQGAIGPIFSPDGQWVGFVADNRLKKISVNGGTVVSLGDVPSATFRGASWGEDSGILVGDYSGVLRIPASGGPPERIVGIGNGEFLASPQMLPGGKAILFSAHSVPDVDQFTIEVMSLADHHRKIVSRGGESPQYLPTSSKAGHLVYVNRSALFAIPFNVDQLETWGTAVPVLDDVGHDAVSSVGQFAVSRTGTLVYRTGRSGDAPLRTLQWVDPTGKREPLRGKPGVYGAFSLSPDGKRVALIVTERGGQDVWVYDPQRDAMTRLTFGDAAYTYPRWSPDGQYVLFSSRGHGIFQARADGASQPRALIQSKTSQFPWSFTPDGKRLAYDDLGVGKWEIWTVPLVDLGDQLKAGTPEQLKSRFYDLNPSFSPDGRWLAYESNESGGFEVYVRAFPPASSGQGGKWQISYGGAAGDGATGGWSRWSPTGHELMYRSGDEIMAASYTVKGDTFVAEKPHVWITELGGTVWDLSPDGQRVAVLTPVESAESPRQEHEVVFLQNFFDELRRRVPLAK